MTDKEKQTFLKEFGYRVKQHRIEKEMSQEELANLVGYTSDNARSSIQKIESGKSDLPASKIRILAEVLEIPVEKLMGWDHKKATEEDLQEWNEKYNPGGKLAAEVNILEEIQKQHGKTAIIRQTQPEIKCEDIASGTKPFSNIHVNHTRLLPTKNSATTSTDIHSREVRITSSVARASLPA